MRLIDADAIIEVMQKCAENPENKQVLLCYRYTQRILEEAPTVEPFAPWHRVEEPPKEYGNYLAVVNGEVMEVTYSDISIRDDWKWSTCDAEGFVWIRSEAVTHWMPLPEPPKEDE